MNRKEKIKIVKIIGAIITFIGILISLLNLFAVFVNNERQYLVEEIKKNGDVYKHNAAFMQFFKAFPPPDGWELKDIKGFGLYSFIRSGGSIIPTGPIIYTGYGKQTGKVVEFDDFVDWSEHSPYPWISWLITLIGWLIVVIGIYLEHDKKGELGTL